MIASPLRIRPASRLAGLAELLLQEGAPEHALLKCAAEELLAGLVAGTSAFHVLADADPAKLLCVPEGIPLAALWAAEVPEWPKQLALDPVWQIALWQFHWLQLATSDAQTRSGFALCASQVKLACLSTLAAMQRLGRVTPEMGESVAVLAQAVVAMLGGASPEPRAFACRVAEVGRELGPLVPQQALEPLIAALRNPGASDDQARNAVRQAIATAGDKPFGWLLQGVAAILEGPAPAAGLDAL